MMKPGDVIKVSPRFLNQPEQADAQFKVAAIGEGKCTLESYNRRDFLKISLVTRCDTALILDGKCLKVDRPALIFTNPAVSYTWQNAAGEDEAEGYFCVFTRNFLRPTGHQSALQSLSLFEPGAHPVYFLSNTQVKYISSVFANMRTGINDDYAYKYELMRIQAELIIHEALKMQPASTCSASPNATARITRRFINLLGRQFPVDSPQHTLKLKKAGDYADELAVHINHLNASVQEVTGKSTTAHINERILAEAKSLLIYTDWSVAEIAGSLGFEYASYFNNFFKKHTGITPLKFNKNFEKYN